MTVKVFNEGHMVPVEEWRKVGRSQKKYWRLPEIEGAGLLWKTLVHSQFSWLEVSLPQDFYQESAAFLLAAPEIPEHPREATTDREREQMKRFFLAVPRHFYKMATDYGFRRPRGSERYVRPEVPLSSQQHEDETYFEAQERLSPEAANPLTHALEKEEFEELVWRSVDLSTFEGRRLVRAILAYRDGLWKEKVPGRKYRVTFTWCGLCGKELEFRYATIDHIVPRARGGHDGIGNLHLAHETCNKFKGDTLPPLMVAVKVGLKTVELPGPNDPPRRVIVGRLAVADASLEEIQEAFGVAKSTAWRIKKRGWYWAGNFHKRPKPKKERPVPRKIECLPDGRPISSVSTREIADTLGITMNGAYRMRQRGYITFPLRGQLTAAQKERIVEIYQSLEAFKRQED